MKNLKYLLVALLGLFALNACDQDGNDFSPVSEGTGTGGSLASFTIIGDYMYSVLDNELKTYELGDNGEITLVNKLSLFGTLETVFPYQNFLLIGSSDGVFFMNLNSPSNPEQISLYRHVTACDPVVARENIAYSTLRASDCRVGRDDLLDVIDITDISNPRLLRSYASDTPFGLAVVPGFLFVCEKGGISVIDNSDPRDLVYRNLFRIPGAVPRDIIPANGYLLVTTDIGIYNLDFNEEAEMQILGQLTGQ